MAPPVRYPNGVTNVGPTADMASLVMLDPTKVHSYFNDFDVYTAGDWTVTATNTTVAAVDGDGGLLQIPTGALENDGAFFEAQSESWLVETGKKLWMKARVRWDVVDEMDFIFGLHTTDTTPQDATERFLFESVDGASTLYFNVDDGTTDTDSSSVTLAVDTWTELAAYWDGKGNIELGMGGNKVKMSSVGAPTQEMALGFGCLTGAAAAVQCDIDYVLVAKER